MLANVNLMALQVVVPLMAAPCCVAFTRRGWSWLLALLASAAAFAIAVILFAGASQLAPLSYAMGGWQPPIGIEYKLDKLNGFMLLLVTGIGLLTTIFAKKSVLFEIAAEKQSLFYAAYLLCLAGLLGIIMTNDAFNVYVFLEISSLAMYALIGVGKDRRALVAALEYLVLGSIGATFILIAVGLLYIQTGTLNMDDLATRLPVVIHTIPVKAALAFFTIGLLLKMAIFPMHLWLVNGYTNAPSFVSSFLSATGTKVMVYVLIRILFKVFGYHFALGEMPLHVVLVVLALAGIVVASLVAVFQGNVKRLLAYSSVAQLGYILLGIGLVSKLGMVAALVHLFNHALAKAALFMAVGCVYYRIGSVRVRDFIGVGKAMPWTMAAFVLAGFSLIGVPGTAGFISKWYLVLALLEQGYWWMVLIVLASSLLAVIYIWKVVEIAYFRERKDAASITEAPLAMLVPLWVTVLLSFYFGLSAHLTVDTATNIATVLFGGAS